MTTSPVIWKPKRQHRQNNANDDPKTKKIMATKLLASALRRQTLTPKPASATSHLVSSLSLSALSLFSISLCVVALSFPFTKALAEYGEIKADAKLKTESAGVSKKAVKDPNKPKRPASVFFVFMEDFRVKYKKDHPNNKSVAAVGKAGGDKWRSLSEAEKAPYVAKAEKRKTKRFPSTWTRSSPIFPRISRTPIS